ncbi:MAG: A/G-specific adenine glycosylase [Clostridia bacterium]|nr:A/G-specific adenine glycosylase [Clostridia bacterium]
MREKEIYTALPALLVPWYREYKRDLPWRQSRDPYRVWLSEIMLQQTRVEAVRDRYLLFLETLPTVKALAEAPEEVLLKLWEGLGYYSRARNLHKAAKAVAESGEFPRSAAELQKLPGVGEYTAGAIASICYGEQIAAVDGNVLRVVSRVLASEAPIDDPATKKKITASLTAVVPSENSGDFTQSFMDLGSAVCTPRSPNCEVCPLAAICRAKARGVQEKLPKKSPKKERRNEQKTLFLLECDGAVAICRRKEKGVLQGLWQLPCLDGALDAENALAAAADFGVRPTAIVRELHREHIFTHIRWDMVCYHLRCALQDDRFVWASPEALETRYALPTAFRKFLEI